MHLKAVIFALSFMTNSAYPLPRYTREATWTDLKANQAHDKTEPTKNVNQISKTNIDSSDLYGQDYHSKSPVAEEMQRKLNMESERLRIRLRQELAELRERLSSSTAHLSSALASMRERLAPLTQQLQSSLSSNTKDLCGQVSLYLQGLETAEEQGEATLALYQEAFDWMNLTLEQSSSQVAVLISDFHTKTIGVIEHLKEISASEQEASQSVHWQNIILRLGQEVSTLRMEARKRTGSLQAEITALLETARLGKDEVTASMERFCQNAALQSRVFQGRMERLFQGLEEELEIQEASSLSPVSSSSLQQDFSVKLSALIQDIMHSVQ
ncbi:apolipoprotein A-IV [Clinocottus analis]|uniref:apolipoprotein A-IV n=1 Tax=Clinocottus analis TaxID=304258 RepID=UPI0035BF64FC